MSQPVIHNPCPEKWEGMTPDDQGRFCGKCSKIVYDFTKKTTQEIIDFLNGRKGEDICGKLGQPKTVAVPVTVAATRRTINSKMSIFAAAVYLVFGALLFTSCGSEPEEEPLGKVGIDSATQAQQERQRFITDSIAKTQETNNVTAEKDTAIDSAAMMETMKILDSLQLLKKK